MSDLQVRLNEFIGDGISTTIDEITSIAQSNGLSVDIEYDGNSIQYSLFKPEGKVTIVIDYFTHKIQRIDVT